MFPHMEVPNNGRAVTSLTGDAPLDAEMTYDCRRCGMIVTVPVRALKEGVRLPACECGAGADWQSRPLSDPRAGFFATVTIWQSDDTGPDRVSLEL